MSRYYCIFLNITKREVTKDTIKDIKTVSVAECTSFKENHCEVHLNESNGTISIQDKCIGHRLKTNFLTISLPKDDFPTDIETSKKIANDQYNKLLKIINNEIEERLKSPLYKPSRNLIYRNAPSMVLPKITILKELIDKLNNYIAKPSLYKDTAPIPKFTPIYTTDIINSNNLKESANAIQTLIKDCICYSDCNGYSMCTCYGNCNHY